MPQEKEFLVEQYRQCHEHQMESNRKRDIAFSLYITVSIGFYGFAARAGLLSDADIFLLFGTLALTVLGIALGFLFTLYRGWTNLYVLQAITLQKIAHKGITEIDGEFVKNIKFKFNARVSVELLIFVILNIIVIIHLFEFFRTINCNCGLVVLGSVFSFIVVIEICFHFFAMIRLDNLKNARKLPLSFIWILQGVYKETK